MNWLPLPVKWLPADFCFLFMDSQNSKGCFSRARARIGVEIIYSLSIFVGHGVNRLKLRCKRVSLIW